MRLPHRLSDRACRRPLPVDDRARRRSASPSTSSSPTGVVAAAGGGLQPLRGPAGGRTSRARSPATRSATAGSTRSAPCSCSRPGSTTRRPPASPPASSGCRPRPSSAPPCCRPARGGDRRGLRRHLLGRDEHPERLSPRQPPPARRRRRRRRHRAGCGHHHGRLRELPVPARLGVRAAVRRAPRPLGRRRGDAGRARSLPARDGARVGRRLRRPTSGRCRPRCSSRPGGCAWSTASPARSSTSRSARHCRRSSSPSCGAWAVHPADRARTATRSVPLPDAGVRYAGTRSVAGEGGAGRRREGRSER